MNLGGKLLYGVGHKEQEKAHLRTKNIYIVDEHLAPEESSPFATVKWEPLYLFIRWVEPDTTTISLILTFMISPGVVAGYFTVHVSYRGTANSIAVKWPAPLVDWVMLHRKFLNADSSVRMETYHPKLFVFNPH